VVSSRGAALRYEAADPAASDAEVARGVVEALAYADVFDWPLTAPEIHRYLPVAARPEDVLAEIHRLQHADD